MEITRAKIMKNLCRFFAALILITLCGCTGPESGETPATATADLCAQSSSGLEMAETDAGYYCKADSMLYYADRSDLTNWVLVCNEPNCSGDRVVCPARFDGEYRLRGNQIETIRNPQLFQNNSCHDSPQLFPNDDSDFSALYTMMADGTGLQQVYTLDGSNMGDGGTSGTWLLQDRILAFYSQIQPDGTFSNSFLQMDDAGTHTLYASQSEEMETPFIARAQDWCAMRGDLAMYIGLLCEDDAFSHLYRLTETGPEEISHICDYDLRGAYLAGNTLLHFVPNDGYYETDLDSSHGEKRMDAQLKDSIAFRLTEQYIVETNRLIDQTHVPAEARLYDGSSWRTISLPEEVAAEHVNLFPVALASDRIFFTTYPDDSQINLYYVLLNDSQPTLTLCWELPRSGSKNISAG